MLTQQARGLVALAGTAALCVLVWAAVTGPVGLLGSSGPSVGPRSPGLTPSVPTEAPPGEPQSAREIIGNRPRQLDLSWLGDLIAWAIFLAFVMAAAAGVGRLWRNRWRPQRPRQVEFEVLPELDFLGDAVARDAAAQLSAVAEGTPRNGIVACWMRLEHAIAEAGLPRHRAETSAEYTVRVLKVLDVDPRAIGTLAGLYREARFSTHELGEDARASAEAALLRLHEDLQEPSR